MQDDSRENLGHPEFADQKIIPLPVPLQEKSFIYLLFHKVPYLHEIFGPLLTNAFWHQEYLGGRGSSTILQYWALS